jgi:hypothetical protein
MSGRKALEVVQEINEVPERLERVRDLARPEVPSGDAVSIDSAYQRTEGIGGLAMVARGAR